MECKGQKKDWLEIFRSQSKCYYTMKLIGALLKALFLIENHNSLNELSHPNVHHHLIILQ